MANVLNVNYILLIGVTLGCAEDIILSFLWLDEDDRSTIRLFQLVRNPGKCNASDDKSVHYNDNDDWPVTNSKADFNGKDDQKCCYNWHKH